MRLLALLLMLVMVEAGAQDVPKKKKKATSKQTEIKAHQKPSAEQIRRFNELEKKK